MSHGYASQASQYLQQTVETASPEQLLIMLYDGAIRFLNVAKRGLEEGNLEKSHKNLISAQNIIIHFMETLNLEVGGEPAQNLYRLYEYLHYRLVQANIKKDAAMVDEAQKHLHALKETWEEAIRLANKEKSEAFREERALSA